MTMAIAMGTAPIRMRGPREGRILTSRMDRAAFRLFLFATRMEQEPRRPPATGLRPRSERGGEGRYDAALGHVVARRGAAVPRDRARGADVGADEGKVERQALVGEVSTHGIVEHVLAASVAAGAARIAAVGLEGDRRASNRQTPVGVDPDVVALGVGTPGNRLLVRSPVGAKLGVERANLARSRTVELDEIEALGAGVDVVDHATVKRDGAN